MPRHRKHSKGYTLCERRGARSARVAAHQGQPCVLSRVPGTRYNGAVAVSISPEHHRRGLSARFHLPTVRKFLPSLPFVPHVPRR